MNNQDPDKTQEVWKQFGARLRGFVQSRVSDASDVDDIVQNAFLKIHTEIHQLRESSRLEAWVFQVVRNTIADYYRARNRSRERTHEGRFDLSEIERDSKSFEIDTTGKALAGCLTGMIDKLPAGQRRALEAYEMDGLSQQALADQERISLSGAKSRIQRGRRALKKILTDCCEFHLDRRGNLLDVTPRAETGCIINCDSC